MTWWIFLLVCLFVFRWDKTPNIQMMFCCAKIPWALFPRWFKTQRFGLTVEPSSARQNSDLFVLDSFPKWPRQTESEGSWNAICKRRPSLSKPWLFCSNKLLKQNHILLLENSVTCKSCTWSTPVYKLSKHIKPTPLQILWRRWKKGL